MQRIADWTKRLAYGAGAGLAGASALQALRTVSQVWFPTSMPPIRKAPGKVAADRIAQAVVGDARFPAPIRFIVAKTFATGYGLTAGALYALVRPRAGNTLIDGMTLGTATWAAGYLGWLPVTDLMPRVTKQSLEEGLGPFVRHLAFGVVTVTTYKWLRREW